MQSVRWVCGVSYDGTDYCGWQTQPARAGARPALQDVVTAAVASIAGHPVALRCAGRTDAGVHALEQVIQFDSPADRGPSSWIRGTTSRMPSGIAVRWAVPMPDPAFDVRFSAKARTYWYLLLDSPVAPPLWRNRVGWTHRPLDDDRIRQATCSLIGTHDFSSFRASDCQAATPIRTIESIEVVREGGLLLLGLTATAFLHHMVRNLVGALVYVGDGRRPVHWLTDVLQARSRVAAAPTFAAGGLYLASVRYDPVWKLPITPKPLRLCELV